MPLGVRLVGGREFGDQWICHIYEHTSRLEANIYIHMYICMQQQHMYTHVAASAVATTTTTTDKTSAFQMFIQDGHENP